MKKKETKRKDSSTKNAREKCSRRKQKSQVGSTDYAAIDVGSNERIGYVGRDANASAHFRNRHLLSHQRVVSCPALSRCFTKILTW